MSMFYFNSDKFDFWEIYESIKRFYPIGIKKDESKMYFSYPGIKALDALILENIHDNTNFTERWVNFTDGLQQQISKEIIGTTYGQGPSFSAYALLDTISLDKVIRTKELHFFVSLVGPFYTVIGRENITVNLDNYSHTSTAYLVVSPENGFADAFKLVCDKIKNRFKGFRFVPFELCRQAIDGLEVRYQSENPNSVFQALFNDLVDLTIQRTIGNDYFGYEDWIRNDYVDLSGGWTSYAPKL